MKVPFHLRAFTYSFMALMLPFFCVEYFLRWIVGKEDVPGQDFYTGRYMLWVYETLFA